MLQNVTVVCLELLVREFIFSVNLWSSFNLSSGSGDIYMVYYLKFENLVLVKLHDLASYEEIDVYF